MTAIVEQIEHNTNFSLGRKKPEGFSVPWDLSEWIDTSLLQNWVMAEVDAFNWNDPRLRALLERHPEFQPRELLALSVYAYTIGILDSEEISFQSVHGSPLHSMSRGCLHSSRDLSRFRKTNRGLIRYVLTQVLKRAARHRYGFGLLLPAGLRRVLEQNAGERLELARHMDRAAEGA